MEGSLRVVGDEFFEEGEGGIKLVGGDVQRRGDAEDILLACIDDEPLVQSFGDDVEGVVETCVFRVEFDGEEETFAADTGDGGCGLGEGVPAFGDFVTE